MIGRLPGPPRRLCVHGSVCCENRSIRESTGSRKERGRKRGEERKTERRERTGRDEEERREQRGDRGARGGERQRRSTGKKRGIIGAAA